MNDTGNIETFDFRPVRLALGSQLKDGDTDFNGVIDFDDYSRTDNGFNTQNGAGFVQSWSRGDFDSNGVVDFDDYSLIDFAFNHQGGSLQRALAWLNGEAVDRMDTPELKKVVEHFSEFGEPYAAAFNLAAVPEPNSVTATLAIVGAALSRRRRNRPPSPPRKLRRSPPHNPRRPSSPSGATTTCASGTSTSRSTAPSPRWPLRRSIH